MRATATTKRRSTRRLPGASRWLRPAPPSWPLRWLRAALPAPPSWPLRWLVLPLCAPALPLLGMLATSGCGASMEAIYEGDVRFEHCMALDAQPEVKPNIRRACWREWLAYYTYGQTKDRVQHAQMRIEQLSDESGFVRSRGEPKPPLAVGAKEHRERDDRRVRLELCADTCDAVREDCARSCQATAARCRELCATSFERCLRSCT